MARRSTLTLRLKCPGPGWPGKLNLLRVVPRHCRFNMSGFPGPPRQRTALGLGSPRITIAQELSNVLCLSQDANRAALGGGCQVQRDHRDSEEPWASLSLVCVCVCVLWQRTAAAWLASPEISAPQCQWRGGATTAAALAGSLPAAH